ncbi:hypothetical protein [Anaerovorax sp. IOR16]|uniref:hypothetical protein n=1 Tax=Anaerovorax sp. IOR16 TaxID=2773458 RepID=UPI0019CF6471|nr:hypothetical protein [Anaerovorax sp. IOR16]
MDRELAKNLSNDILIQMCNEIYDWKNGNGDLLDGIFRVTFLKLYDDKKYSDIRDFENDILIEAHERFGKIVKGLFVDRPRLYLRR